MGVAGVVALLGGVVALPAGSTLSRAGAVALPLSPTDPAVAEQWVNPLLRPNESDEQVSLQLVDSQPVITAPGEPVTVTLELHNHTEETVSNLRIQSQRADAVNSASQARQVLGYEAGAYPWFGAQARPDDDLAPGETRQLQMELPTAPRAGNSLTIDTPGVYPVLFALSGQPENGPVTRYSTERFLLNATGENPPADPATDPGAGQDGPGAPMTMLYPITAETDILPGETGDAPGDTPLLLRTEDLAAELSEGGRLHRLLQEYRQAVAAEEGEALRAASCLAVDPGLLDTVDRMSRGYTVDESRQIEENQNQRLRDSWTATEDPDPGTPGTGQADAEAWLSDLRATAQDSCIVALPWSNANLDAVHATGNQWLMRETLERGSATLHRILGVEPTQDVVIPGSGYVSPETAPALGWADQADNQAQPAESPQPGSLENAWEQQAADAAGGGTPAGEPETNTLDDTTPPNAGAARLPQPPAEPVSVLVADNTVWGAPQVDRFAELAPGITGVTYQDSLAATLAATGPAPETVGYSNPDTRFDARIDSAAARDLTAAATLRLAAAELNNAATAAGEAEADPLFVMPPAHLNAATASVLLDTSLRLLGQDTVTPLSFSDYLSPAPEQQEQLDATEPADAPGTNTFGAPFADPTAFSDAEVLRTAQQANYIDDLTRVMTNDPAISLTRYQFTAPLRRDLLTALSTTGRRSLETFTRDVDRTDERLTGNRQVLQSLGSSVSLIPPGNVYTRTSESSPLLIVAENRLPLPAQATIIYDGPEGARLNVPPEIRIPAMGSITLQMTADLPENEDRTDLVLRLATMDGAAISDPVEISVQTRAGLVGTSAVAVALAVGLVLALIFRIGSRRKRQTSRRSEGADTAAGTEAAATSGRDTDTAPSGRSAPRRGVGQAGENSGSPKPPGAD